MHNFLPAALDAVTQDGRIYGAPIYQTVTTTIYNKRLLAEYGSQAPLPFPWPRNGAPGPRVRYGCVPPVVRMTWGV
ncbi:hypothetical protein ACFYR3_39245, partial [Streptomyces sp. NPDC005784]